MNTQLSVVVPVYGSASGLAALAGAVQDALRQRFDSYELILVNDCSPDDSWSVIVELTRHFDFLIGVNLRKNVGQDNAIMAGLHQARGAVVVVMDDDLQHDPADIPRLYEEIQRGFDVVWARFERKEQAFWKNLGSRMVDRMAVALLGKPRDVYLSPYKAIRRDVVGEILKYDGPYSYVDGILLTVTSNFTQIPATHHARITGQGNYGLVRSVAVGLKLVTSFSVIPLRIASVTGGTIALVAFVVALAFIFEKLFGDYDVPGWATLIVTVLFLGGVQLLGIGALGEYIGRIFLTLNRRPQFSIQEIRSGDRVTRPFSANPATPS